MSEFVETNDAIRIANELYYSFKDRDFKEQSEITKEALKQPEKKSKKNFFNNIINRIIWLTGFIRNNSIIYFLSIGLSEKQ